MAEYTVHYQGRRTLPDAGACAMAFQIRSDSTEVQAVEILVSSPDLENRGGITSDHQRFWPAVAVAGLRAIRLALEHKSIPTTTPNSAWIHYVNRSAVDRIIGSDAELPVLVDHTGIARFTV
jgi:hypothetical protein